MNTRSRIMIVILLVLVLLAVAVIVLGQPETRLFALDGANGGVLWSVAIPKPASAPVIFAGNGRVYAGIDYGPISPNVGSAAHDDDLLALQAFDAAAGTLLWEFKFEAETFGRVKNYTWVRLPAVIGDTIYLYLTHSDSSVGEDLVAIDAQRGALKWVLKSKGLILDTRGGTEVIQVGDKLAALLSDLSPRQDRLALIDPATGAELQTLWQSSGMDNRLEQFRQPRLQANAGALYLATDNTVYAFDLSGKTLFTLPTKDSARILVTESALYVQQIQEGINAYDPLSGALRWQYKTDALPDGAYLLNFLNMGDTIYTVCRCDDRQKDPESFEDLWLIALNASDGVQRWTTLFSRNSHTTLFTVPAILSDRVIMRSGKDTEALVRAFAAPDGAVLWTFTRTELARDPVTDGTHVFTFDSGTRLQMLLRR